MEPLTETTTLSSPVSPGDFVSPTREKVVRRKRVSVLSWIATGVLLGFGMLLIAGSLFHVWSVNTVLSGSMRPTIQPGDVIVAMPENISELKVGQVLVFRPPGQTETLAHRIVKIEHYSGGTVVRTQGDANNVEDAWKAQITGNSAWTVRYVIPNAGAFLLWAKTPWIKIGSLVLVGVLVVWLGLEKIWKKPVESAKASEAISSEV